MRVAYPVLALLALTCVSATSSAQLYKWIDERGITNYSNDAPPAATTANKLTRVENKISVYTPDESFMTGIELSHVPYKGTGPALPDLISGRVQLYINPLLAMIGAVEGGRLRVLAVTSAKRVATLPDVPTVAESGVPGYEATSWYMLLVPGKTPASVVSKINAETLKALKDKDMIDLLTRGGADPLGNSPREAMEFLKVEIARWGKAVKQAGVKIE